MSDTEPFKYWAFIRYSHHDRRWAAWLIRRLEANRLPRDLVGREVRDGPLPPRLFPIFRDRVRLKLIAGLLGVGYDELRRHDHCRRHHRGACDCRVCCAAGALAGEDQALEVSVDHQLLRLELARKAGKPATGEMPSALPAAITRLRGQSAAAAVSAQPRPTARIPM